MWRSTRCWKGIAVGTVAALATAGCDDASHGGGGSKEVPVITASFSGLDLDDGGSAGGAVQAAASQGGALLAVTGGPGPNGPSAPRARCRVTLRDDKGKPIKVDLDKVSLEVFETEAALRLLPRVGVAIGPYPYPPSDPFPGKSSRTLTGQALRLREKQHPHGDRDIEAVALRTGSRFKLTLAADGTLKKSHLRNGRELPDIAVMNGVLCRVVPGATGEVVAVEPLEAALLGPVSYIGSQATTFERYTEAPETGYGTPTLSAGNAYAVRLPDETYAKVWVVWKSVTGNGKHVSYLIEYVHQCDGSRALAPSWVRGSGAEVGDPEPPRLAVGFVADNSGSERGFLEPLKEGLSEFVGRLDLPRDEAALVRVSTVSTVRAELGGDEAALLDAVDALYIANGNTALYDGIRLAAETLEDGFGEGAAGAAPYPALVVFTDGKDNNSADELNTSYAGDGIDTTFEDCTRLTAGGVPVPVYTIALGNADKDELEELAEQSGGAAFDATDNHAIRDAYAAIRDTIEAGIGLSFDTGFTDASPFARRTLLLVLTVEIAKVTFHVTGFVQVGHPGREATCELESGRKVRVGHRPRAAARIPGGHLALVANAGENTLSLVDLQAGLELDWDDDPMTRSRGAPLGISRLPVGRGPASVAVTSAGDLAVVANEKDGTVSLVDLVARAELTRVPVGRGPVSVALSPDDALAYVACRLDDAVWTVDLAALDAVRTPVGDDPSAVGVSGGTLFVLEAHLTNTNTPGALVAYDRATMTELSRVTVSRAPTSMVVDATRVYLANRRSGSLSVVDITNPAAIDRLNTFTIGKNPSGPCFWKDAQGRSFVSYALAGEDSVVSFRRANLRGETYERLAAGDSPVQVLPYTEGGALVTVDMGSDSLTYCPLPELVP